MSVLALEPFYGGSHRAFLDGWAKGSRHNFEILSLPAYKWKWRMRHSALTFAEQIAERSAPGHQWDVLFCSDMLDLAQLKGLEPKILGALPSVVYFHENQLTYPVQEAQERDLHYAFTNFTSAIAADEVWFNSAYHQMEWLGALAPWLRRMPDYRPSHSVEEIRHRSRVMPPGIDPPLERKVARESGSLHIAWVARWEHDKDPDTFFQALENLKSRGIPFRLSVLGERFHQVPMVFAGARDTFAAEIEHWGFLPSREQYLEVLAAADVVVSTARHEFFGLAVVEAIAHGCLPVLPERLAYPEILAPVPSRARSRFFFDGSVESLSQRLVEWAATFEREGVCEEVQRGISAVERFYWPALLPVLDAAIEGLVER